MGELSHSEVAAANTVLLHHPQLVADELQIDQLAMTLRLTVANWQQSARSDAETNLSLTTSLALHERS